MTAVPGRRVLLLTASALLWLGCDRTDPPDRAAHRDVVTAPSHAPAWAVPYGHEPDRRTTAGAIDPGDVIDRVTHAIARDGDRATVTARAFTATFDGRGLRFAPTGQGATPATTPTATAAAVAVDLRTARIAAGARDLYLHDPRVRVRTDATPWTILGNTAQTALAPALVEHHEVRADGVHVSWLVRPGAVRDGEDLRIDASLAGAATAARLGAATLVDARGHRWPVPVARTRDGARWEVDRATLADAIFPVALTFTLGPSLDLGQPVPSAVYGFQDEPAIASNGTDYLVVWRDYLGRASIRAARVSAAGVVLDPSGLLLATSADPGYVEWPAVASNGTGYLVVWEDFRSGGDTLRGGRVSAAGAVLDPGGFPVATGGRPKGSPAVASDGSGYLVAWNEEGGDHEDWTIAGARVSAAGVVLDPAGIDLTTADSHQTNPSLAWTGTDYLVAWSDSRGVYGGRVSPAGALLDGGGFPIHAGAGRQPSVAAGGDGALVAWTDFTDGSWNVRGRRVVAGAAVGGTLAISAGPGGQLDPVVASDGAGYFVAWYDGRNDARWDVYGARVSAAGVVLEPAGIPISTALNFQQHPAIASNGDGYMLVWQDDRGGFSQADDIYAARISSAGDVLDAQGLLVNKAPSYQQVPSVASNGTDYLVVWQDYRAPNGDEIIGARVSASGAILDPAGFAIAAAPDSQRHPQVASDGTNYFVVWQDYRALQWDVYGARVTAAGQVLDPGGRVITTADSLIDPREDPSIASNGDGYLVVWTRSTLEDAGIFGTRVSLAGAVLDGNGVRISPAGTGGQFAGVASNGTDYLVAWFDRESGTGPVRALRLSPSGTALDAAPLTMGAATSYYQGARSVASNGTDYLVVWQAMNGDHLDVRAGRVTAAGTAPDGSTGFAIATGAGDQDLPSVASNGTDYLVAWQDDRDGESDVYATEVTAAGAVLDPGGVALAATAALERHPGLASAAGGYLVAHDADARIRGRLLLAPGGPPDGMPDAGVPDGGTPDGGVPDGGVPDGGVSDAGVPDAGVPDGGSPDAGVPDAGSVPDSGSGSVPDAGTGGPDAHDDAGGSDGGGCSAARGPNWFVTFAVLLSLLALARRRFPHV